jgi:hypothetical protein
MPKVNLKTISYNLARQNYSNNRRKVTTVYTKWNSQSGERLLESFSVAAKGGFMKEFHDRNLRLEP